MRLNVKFNSTDTNLPVGFNSDNDINLNLGSVMEIETGDHRKLLHRDDADQHPIGAITGLQDIVSNIPVVLCDTTANWRTYIDYVAPKGAIVIYSDYATVDDKPVPNIKIGDGLAYLIDLPYVNDDLREALLQHINDATAHITAAERAKWNNKVSCSVSQIGADEYLLIFETG